MTASLLGELLCKPAVRDFLYHLARQTPDMHIMSPDGKEVYMYRYWLFNPIDPTTWKRKYRFIPFSLRIHHIVRPDEDRHPHDHPFNARTWILRGGYEEVRLVPMDDLPGFDRMVEFSRLPGDTATLGHNQYHRITKLYGGEAVTLFAFGPYKGQWGFRVNGEKMLRAEYFRRYKSAHPASCKAVQNGDLTECSICDLAWDTNDVDRPRCRRRSNDRETVAETGNVLPLHRREGE